LVRIVHDTGLAPEGDYPLAVAGCELVLEALVARKRISRNDAGEYGRVTQEPRRRGNDLFGQQLG
jgi:magnesium chelatase subunit I